MIDSMSASLFRMFGYQQETIRHDPIVAVWGFSLTARHSKTRLTNKAAAFIVTLCVNAGLFANAGRVTGAAAARQQRTTATLRVPPCSDGTV
jgi:hypothetical protein